MRDSEFSLANVTVPQGSTVAWSFPSYNVNDHTVTDGTGMGLFDSGDRGPGGSFKADFIAAGTYTIQAAEVGATRARLRFPLPPRLRPGFMQS